jgi:hypothetical protein
MMDDALINVVDEDEEYPADRPPDRTWRQKSYVFIDDIPSFFPRSGTGCRTIGRGFAALMSGIPYVEDPARRTI